MRKRIRTKLVYTAGPYRCLNRTVYGIRKNIEIATEWFLRLWKDGASVISPHRNTGFLDGAHGLHGSDWLDGDFTQIERCDAVFLLPNWEKSYGTLEEIEVAKAAGIPVFTYDKYDEFLEWLNK